jgi:hypothetical protein
MKWLAISAGTIPETIAREFWQLSQTPKQAAKIIPLQAVAVERA